MVSIYVNDIDDDETSPGLDVFIFDVFDFNNQTFLLVEYDDEVELSDLTSDDIHNFSLIRLDSIVEINFFEDEHKKFMQELKAYEAENVV
ncbi:hypothetical protein [uncultured Thomasclavelia sp.]|uniref:hypothetical protein n=1 Tax=uncultured Thomasclavelia sp. TaxID=3025759 RepID=UPI00261B3D1E|nr:hypothetical protein [uncultured Thomasclavelia sp.]